MAVGANTAFPLVGVPDSFFGPSILKEKIVFWLHEWLRETDMIRDVI